MRTPVRNLVLRYRLCAPPNVRKNRLPLKGKAYSVGCAAGASQFKLLQLGDDLLLALVEEQLLMGEVFLAAATGDAAGTVVTDRELSDEDQDLLTVAAEYRLASYYNTHS